MLPFTFRMDAVKGKPKTKCLQQMVHIQSWRRGLPTHTGGQHRQEESPVKGTEELILMNDYPLQ